MSYTYQDTYNYVKTTDVVLCVNFMCENTAYA